MKFKVHFMLKQKVYHITFNVGYANISYILRARFITHAGHLALNSTKLRIAQVP